MDDESRDYMERRWRVTGSDRDRDEVILAYMGRAEQIALDVLRKMAPGGDRDALLGAGYEVLTHAVRAFDASRGVPLSAWVSMRVRQGVIDEVRRMRHFGERASDPATIDRVAVERGDPARLVERQDELRRLVDLVAALPERERILIGAGLEGATVREAARAIGIHESRASRLLSRALGRLRAAHAGA